MKENSRLKDLISVLFQSEKNLSADERELVATSLKEITETQALNQKNDQGNTLLHLAIEKGYTDIVTILLNKEGVDKELPNRQGLTPLLLAISKWKFDIAAVLVEKDADLHAIAPSTHKYCHFTPLSLLHLYCPESETRKKQKEQLLKLINEKDGPANLSQFWIIEQFKKYLKLKKEDLSYDKNEINKIIASIGGFCFAFAYTWILKNEQERATFFDDLRKISRWDGSEDQFDEDKQLEGRFERYISILRFIHKPLGLIEERYEQLDNTNVQILLGKNDEITEHFSHLYFLKTVQLPELLNCYLKENTPLRLCTKNHAIAIEKKGESIIIYDSNHALGEHRTSNSVEAAQVINAMLEHSTRLLITFTEKRQKDQNNQEKTKYRGSVEENYRQYLSALNVAKLSTEDREELFEASMQTQSPLLKEFILKNQHLLSSQAQIIEALMRKAIKTGDTKRFDLMKLYSPTKPLFEWTLIEAIKSGKVNMIKHILQSQPDMQKVDKDHKNALCHTLWHALWHALKTKNVEILKSVLPYIPDSQDSQEALKMASFQNEEIFQTVIRYYQNKNTLTNDHWKMIFDISLSYNYPKTKALSFGLLAQRMDKKAFSEYIIGLHHSPDSALSINLNNMALLKKALEEKRPLGLRDFIKNNWVKSLLLGLTVGLLLSAVIFSGAPLLITGINMQTLALSSRALGSITGLAFGLKYLQARCKADKEQFIEKERELWRENLQEIKLILSHTALNRSQTPPQHKDSLQLSSDYAHKGSKQPARGHDLKVH